MKRIVVAHDGSPLSHAVLEEAIALATAWEAKIRLLRAVSIPAVPPSTNRVLDAIVEAATSSLRTAAKAIPPALRDGLSLDVGVPCRVALAAARTYEADLIVIGAHGHGTSRQFLGNTAARIVEHATVPVLVVRPMSDRVHSVVRRSCASAPA
jgi:nucleotide-binding universal stress UspA family protein